MSERIRPDYQNGPSTVGSANEPDTNLQPITGDVMPSRNGNGNHKLFDTDTNGELHLMVSTNQGLVRIHLPIKRLKPIDLQPQEA